MKTPGRRSGNLYVPGTVLVAVYQLVAVDNIEWRRCRVVAVNDSKSRCASRIRPINTIEAHLHRGKVTCQHPSYPSSTIISIPHHIFASCLQLSDSDSSDGTHAKGPVSHILSRSVPFKN
jgi:hypothetical protein